MLGAMFVLGEGKWLHSPWCCFVEDIHKVGARSHIEAVRTRLKNQGNGVSWPKRG